ncbi:MAG: pyruvate kinase [Chloroflexota bacterium]
MCRTRIVCTLGPATSTEGVLQGLIEAGMDVARINCSHGDHAAHGRSIQMVRQIAQAQRKVIAILLDLQGPRLRVGELATGQVVLRPGQEFTLTARSVPGDDREVFVHYPDLSKDVVPGNRILIDDGLLELSVLWAQGQDVRCRVVTGGILRPHKGMNLPSVQLSTPSLTDKDKEDTLFGIEQNVDYIALSFVRQAADVASLKGFLGQHGASIPVVAKIEKPEAVEAFGEILKEADGIMVARGDLGVEMAAEQVPLIQKSIIARCRQAGKPVITATQMLDSMIRNPRPTRAESSDVANAILDGTDAVMLSGETAAGAYPVEAARTMARIAQAAEEALPYQEMVSRASQAPATNVTDAIGQATCEIAYELGAGAIITATESGYTARMVAKHRPKTPIIGVTSNPATQKRLALVWGVHSLLAPRCRTTDEMFECAVQTSLQAGLISPGSLVVITAGVPVGSAGRTNLLKVHLVGERGM